MSNEVAYRRYPLVILFSGGLDGTLAYEYARHHLDYAQQSVALVNVNYEHPYGLAEREAIGQVLPLLTQPNYYSFYVNLLRPDLGNVPTPQQQIVGGRNLMLAYFGAYLSDEEVWICALKGEIHPFMHDKSEAFFRTATDAMTTAFGREITVTTPFRDKTKAELLEWYVDAAGRDRAQRLADATTTCYDTQRPDKGCNECTACFKRWVAYAVAGLEWERFERPDSRPIEDLLARYRAAIANNDFSHYSLERLQETDTALRTVGERLMP